MLLLPAFLAGECTAKGIEARTDSTGKTYRFSRRPRIGVVLSGGGAKGVAHIALLQTLDSLGIVPDYIAGTSMGAVVGGLYAAGYSGDSLKKIVDSITWNEILTNQPPLSEINIEEKDEAGKYVYELPVDHFRPRVPMGLIDGQKLEELLARLFFPVHAITNFDSLATPFLCMAFDVIKGDAVIQRKGNLVRAIRSSMAIPTVFTPIHEAQSLLVDGGVSCNFPVSYCRDMGADFIIGSDVGSGMYDERSMNSVAKLLMQTAMLASNKDNQRQRQLCDILVSYEQTLTYQTGDFVRSLEIWKQGKMSVAGKLAELAQFADAIHAFPSRKRKLPDFNRNYVVGAIRTTGLSYKTRDFALRKFGLSRGDTVSIRELENRLRIVFGTRMFDRINFAIEPAPQGSGELVLNGKEAYNGALKGAVHYDTEQGVGVIVNLTLRNFLGTPSRLSATADISETPRLRFHYYHFLNKKVDIWLSTGVYFEGITQNAFYRGVTLPASVNNFTDYYLSLNKSFSKNSYVSLGIHQELFYQRAKVKAKYRTTIEETEVDSYHWNHWFAEAKYYSNTLNKRMLPTTGKEITLIAKYAFNNKYRYDLYLRDSVNLSSGKSVEWEGLANPYLRLEGAGTWLCPVSKQLSFVLQSRLGLTFNVMLSNSSKNMTQSLGQGDFFSVGGIYNRPRSTVVPFYGLRENEISAPQIALGSVGAQFRMGRNVYLTPTFNLLAGGYDPGGFFRNVATWKTISAVPDQNSAFHEWGYGVTGSFSSIFGPISLTVSKASHIDQLRVFFGFGFWM